MTNMMIEVIDKIMHAKWVSYCPNEHESCLPFKMCLSVLFFEVVNI